jgi:hypothetical protein
VTISGRAVPPLAKPPAEVVITRQAGCGRAVVVARVVPARSGAFTASVRRPAGARAAVFRAQTAVRRTTSSRRASRTFSLPAPVDLR